LKIIKKYLKSIFCSIVIIILCFIPGGELPQSKFDVPYIDKIFHFSFFFVLSLIVQYEIKNKVSMKNYLLIFIYVLALGGFIELVQENFIEERDGDFFDLVADLSGAIIAFFIFKDRVYPKLAKLKFIIGRK
jgi:VanZ family protein